MKRPCTAACHCFMLIILGRVPKVRTSGFRPVILKKKFAYHPNTHYFKVETNLTGQSFLNSKLFSLLLDQSGLLVLIYGNCSSICSEEFGFSIQSRPFHSKNCALCTARYLFCAEENRLLIGQPVSPNTLIFFILNISCDLVILCLNKQGKLNSFQSVMSQMSTESLLTISRLKFKLLAHKVELKNSLRNVLNVLLYYPWVEISHAK